MSVLESMRSGTDSTFMQIVLAIVVVSFIGWGAQNGGSTQDIVATVNGEAITSIEYNEAVRFAEQKLERATTGAVTAEQRADARERALQDLIRMKALSQEAAALGIEVSDAEVANQLLDEPALQVDGKFSMQAYENAIRRRGTTRANFEEDLRADLLLRKLSGLMQLGASVSEPVVKQTYIDQNTKVNLEFVRIRPAAFSSAVAPTEAEIATWIAENGDALKARYERDFSRLYDKPETVTLSMIKLVQGDDGLALADLKPKLDAVKVAIEGGQDFSEAARRWSEDASAADGGGLGERPASTLDEADKKALETLEVGKLTDVIVGARDVRLYRLEARSAARVVPLDEVQAELALALIREAQAPAKAVDFAEKTLLAKWKEAGELPTAELEPLGLKASTTGPIPLSGASAGLFKPPEALLKAASKLEAGSVVPEVFEDQGVYWVAKLIERTEADMSAYEAERDEVRERALLEARMKFVEDWMADVVARATVAR
jgi:peptidyl-prolyl cis-trans isomerase D